MRRSNLSTPLPRLAKGEPGCREIDNLTEATRAALISAHLGTLRRAPSAWYGPDKLRPIHRRTVGALIDRGLIYQFDPLAARITKRGQWWVRSIGSENADEAFTTTESTTERAS